MSLLTSLLVSGCTTVSPVHTDPSSANAALRPRTVTGPYKEIIQLAVQSANEAMPGGNVTTDVGAGIIAIENPSFWTGDTAVKIVASANP